MSERDIVDYALQRRAVLADVAAGRSAKTEVCDAHRFLLLAAKHYGLPLAERCPVCNRRRQRHVHYVYGDALGKSSGQAKNLDELDDLAASGVEFDLYIVEVCLDCGWNHLIRSSTLGSSDDTALDAATGQQ